MDSITSGIAHYTAGLKSRDLTPSARAATRLRIMDTFACAWGGIDAPAVKIAKRAMLRNGLTGPVNLIGGGSAPCEEAAFLNGLMSRVLEMNDWSPPTFHGSDMVFPLLALAEELGRDGEETMLAIVVAHQVFGALNKAFGVHNKRIGWDGGVMLSPGTAAGAAKLLRLDEAGIANAVSIAASGGPTTRVRGSGEITLWTRGEGPQECMLAIWSALLASEGMIGPMEPYEGQFGIWQMVTGKFDLRHLAHDRRFYMEETMTKLIPASFAAHAPIVAALGMRDEIGDLSEIESIRIETYDFAKNGIGRPESWDPKTPAAADHSFPYLIAAALTDGNVTLASFEPDMLSRPGVRDLMNRITIEEKPEFSTAFPEKFMHHIFVRMRDGRTVDRLTTVPPPGHPDNPATAEQLDDKFKGLMGAWLSADAIRELREKIDRFEQLGNIKELTGMAADRRQAA